MTWNPILNPTPAEISGAIARSKHRAARRIIDQRNGDIWIWPAEQAFHAAGAALLGVPYDKPAGTGDILTDD
jgi:hypothetical protein